MNIKLLLKKEVIKQFLRFFLVGLECATVYYLVFIVLYHFSNIHYLLSTSFGFLASTSFGFVFNKMYTFSSKRKFIISFPLYLSVYSFTLIFTLLAIRVLVENVKIDPLLSMLILIPITAIINFLGIKIIAFRNFKWN